MVTVVVEDAWNFFKQNLFKIEYTPEAYYKNLPKTLITSYNKEIEFKQEMQGVAEIITEDLRLIERVFYQFKKIFKQ